MNEFIQMPITTIPLSFLADLDLNKAAPKSKDKSEADSFKIRWKNFIEITKSEEFSKNYPVTSEYYKKVFWDISWIYSKKIMNEQKYILRLFKREKFWKSYKIPIKLDKNGWQSLLQDLKSEQFQKKYPVTYLYHKSIGVPEDSLKRLLLELYNKEKLLNSGKISKADFNVYYFKICLKTIKYLEQIFIGSVCELSDLMYPSDNKKIKKKQSDSLTLAGLKIFRNKNKYSYTFYFLRDKNTNLLSANDLNIVKKLVDIDNFARINNFAYDVLYKSTTLYNELDKFWGIRGNRPEKTMDSRFAYYEANKHYNDYALDWHIGKLKDLSERLYSDYMLTYPAAVAEAKNLNMYREIFSGKIIKPEKLEENIKALEVLPLAVLKYLEENGVRIIFYPYIEKIYIKVESDKKGGYVCVESKDIYNGFESFSGTLHEIGHLIFEMVKENPGFKKWFRKFIELVEKRKSIKEKLRSYLYKKEKLDDIVILQHIKGFTGYLDYVKAVINKETFTGFVLANRSGLKINEKNEYFPTFWGLYFEYILEKNNPNYYLKDLPTMDSEIFELFKELQSLLN